MKLEFNVVRMANEDVIATSEQGHVCDAHPDCGHIYTISDVITGAGSPYINAYFYDSDQTTPDVNECSPATDSFESSPVKGKWYYWDNDAGLYGQYKECTGDHSDYTTDTH